MSAENEKEARPGTVLVKHTLNVTEAARRAMGLYAKLDGLDDIADLSPHMRMLTLLMVADATARSTTLVDSYGALRDLLDVMQSVEAEVDGKADREAN